MKSMLTRKQFLQKHAQKYAKMSKSEKDQRYADYLANGNGAPVRRTPNLDSKMRVVQEIQPNHKFGWKALISPCTAMYTKALTNPFGQFDELPCIPDVITLPSYKFQTTTRGSFSVGSGGVGFVAGKPGCPVSDSPCIEYTLPTFAGGSYQPALPSPPVGVATANNDSVFTQADFQVNGIIESRLVGAGLRVHYQGSEINRGGLVVLHRQPGNTAIAGNSTAATLLQFKTSTQAPATRNAESVNYRPDTPGMLGYAVPVFPQASTLMIYVEGGSPGTSWNYEFIQFFELIGNRQNPTASHSDPVGMGSALGSLPVNNSLDQPWYQEAMSIRRLAQNLQKSTSGMQFVSSVGNTLKAGFKVAKDIVSSDYGSLLVDVPNYYKNLVNASDTGTRYALGAPSRGPLVEEID